MKEDDNLLKLNKPDSKFLCSIAFLKLFVFRNKKEVKFI